MTLHSFNYLTPSIHSFLIHNFNSSTCAFFNTWPPLLSLSLHWRLFYWLSVGMSVQIGIHSFTSELDFLHQSLGNLEKIPATFKFCFKFTNFDPLVPDPWLLTGGTRSLPSPFLVIWPRMSQRWCFRIPFFPSWNLIIAWQGFSVFCSLACNGGGQDSNFTFPSLLTVRSGSPFPTRNKKK